DKIYLKIICDEGFAASKVELLDAGYQHISDVAIGEDGVCVIENGDGWQQFYAKIIVDELAGYFTCELAREDDAGKLTLAYDFDTEIEYYKDQDISIKTVSGTVYTAVASSATVSNIILQRDGDVFRFRPNSESYEDYVITFYTSEEEYLFETLQGDKVAMCYPVDMTGESGSLEFTDIDHSHSYQGCTKWSYTGDAAEIVIRPNQDYDYTVMVGETDVTASAKTNDNKYVIEGTGWPTITFFALSVLESDTTDTAFEGDLGTSYAMTAKIKNTGVQVASYTWFKSEDNGANYVQLETTTATLNDTPTTSSIYKCVVADTNGRSIDIFFNVNVIFRIVDNTSNDAKSVTITKTESATLAVDIDETKTTGLTYKWQNSNDSEHWNDMTETTKSITVTPNATTSYKCTVTDEHNNAPVEIMFTVTVIVPELTDARTDSQKVLKVLYGSGSTFRVVTSLDGKNADLQYTWSRSTDGESYVDLPATVDTPHLGFAINNDFPYFYYKCIVTDKYGNVLPLVFTIDPEYSFTADAKDDTHEFTVFKSESAELAVEINDVNTDEVAISWCVSADGTTPGDAVPNSDDKTSITVSPDATTHYICHIEDSHGNSADIYFTVNVAAPVITDNTEDPAKTVKLELGESATLTANIDETTTSGITYTWYESEDPEAFTKTIDGTTNEVTVTPRTTTYYCCKVADGFGNSESVVFKVEVSYALTDTTTETTKTITKFDSTTITASVDRSKALGPITYSWSCSTDGTNYAPMETQTKATITVSPLVTTYYKCLVADGDRNSVEIKFTVKVSVPELKDTTSASAKSVTATKDDTITLTASVNENETTGIAYKWTQSTDGKTFTPVSNGTSKTLSVKVTENITYVCTVTDKYENKVEIKFTVTAKDKVTPAPSTPAPEEQQFEGFVERLYNVALGRDSEQGGKDYWCDLVGNGQLTGADAARSFLKSPEFHDKHLSDEEFLKVLYKTFFDREPDPEGLQYWLGVLKTTSQDAVVEGFINSTEWCNVCASYGVKSGATNAKATIPSANAVAFAKRLYTECLGREAEKGGLDYWSLALTNLEVTGSGAARLFFESDEFIGFKTDDKEYLTRLYKTFMGRDPDDAGMNYWLGVLKAQSREAVFNSFVASQEFTDICNSYGINR
ncbi:MAG: DUF4214 domain-containing protein, partial [Clostridiales bacterium]|nr:DUF4214 domain-containing protein [Clostridiales bacterium]